MQRVEPEEAIRTKRKFQHLRVAKRLPHYTAHQSEFEGVWEVHAAVLDVGAFEADVVGERDGIHMTAPLSNPPHSASKVGRSVRFEDESARKAPQGVETKSASDADQSATSSYSLSKFKFPAPPGHNWAGTFGTYPFTICFKVLLTFLQAIWTRLHRQQHPQLCTTEALRLMW